MNQLEFHRNELQIDYFSDSYRRFESDFYCYSSLDTPLTFLIDDILLFMFKSKKNYFKLNKENAKDHRDHYFIFSIETLDEQKSIRKFAYQKAVCSVKYSKKEWSPWDLLLFSNYLEKTLKISKYKDCSFS